MLNLGREGTCIRRELGSVGFSLWWRFGYCRTGHNHGSANHDYDSSYYDGGTDNDHGSANHDYDSSYYDGGTDNDHGSANHDYDSSYYDGGSYYHGERVRWRPECPRGGGVLFGVLVVFS